MVDGTQRSLCTYLFRFLVVRMHTAKVIAKHPSRPTARFTNQPPTWPASWNISRSCIFISRSNHHPRPQTNQQEMKPEIHPSRGRPVGLRTEARARTTAHRNATAQARSRTHQNQNPDDHDRQHRPPGPGLLTGASNARCRLINEHMHSAFANLRALLIQRCLPNSLFRLID